jgi:hypothetical protein
MGRAPSSAVLVALLAATAADAQPNPLYHARTITTGTDMRERPAGLARCLVDVLVKVSGNPALAEDPRTQALAPQAAALLEDLDYRDRLGHLPTQDEQGSRDRPYVLACRFAPDRIDHALRGLGAVPWAGPRPAMRANVTMTDRTGETLVLLADTPRGDGPRAALMDAAERLGLRVLLPQEGAPPPAAATQLDGRLAWRPETFGWTAEWSLVFQQRPHRWRVEGVSYDAAMLAGMRGAAAVLSGNAAALPAATRQ